MAKKKKGGSPLFSLMADMANNPKLAQAFRDNAAEVMTRKKYDLPTKQRKLLLDAMNNNRHLDAMKVIADEADKVYGIHPDTPFIP